MTAWPSPADDTVGPPSAQALARRLPRRPFLVTTYWWITLLMVAFPVLTVALLPGAVHGLHRGHLVLQVLTATVLTRAFAFFAARWFSTGVQAVIALVTRDHRVVVAEGERVIDAVAARLRLGVPAHQHWHQPGLIAPLGAVCAVVLVVAGWTVGGRPAALLSGILLGVTVGLVRMLVNVHRTGASGEDRLEPVVGAPVLAAYRRVTGRPLPPEGVGVQDLYTVLRDHPEVAAAVAQRMRAERLFPTLTARASFTEGIALWVP